MRFKKEKDRQLFWELDIRLRYILIWLEYGFKLNNLPELKITSTIRKKKLIKNESGIHACGRAADISIKGLSEEDIKWIVKSINKKFVYGGKYNTALRHDVGFGDHIHLQVPPQGELLWGQCPGWICWNGLIK